MRKRAVRCGFANRSDHQIRHVHTLQRFDRVSQDTDLLSSHRAHFSRGGQAGAAARIRFPCPLHFLSLPAWGAGGAPTPIFSPRHNSPNASPQALPPYTNAVELLRPSRRMYHYLR